MTAPNEMPTEWVWLARIRHPQGRKGEVLAEILTDFPEKFSERKQLWLLDASGSARPVALHAHWLHKGGVVLHFEGVDSISTAEPLSGLVVALPLSERAPLGADEVYIGDLIGCQLFDVAASSAVLADAVVLNTAGPNVAVSDAIPNLIGEIIDVDRTAGPVALLVVSSAAGEVLVPFAKAYLRSIDIAGRRVEMALPEGLVEVNLRPE